MNDNKAQSTGFWAGLSKAKKLATSIGAIIGIPVVLITTLIAINNYRLSNYKVDARGYCSLVYLSENLYKSAPDPAKGRLKNLDSIWWITVENRGKTEVQGLVLELPFDGLYEVEIGATTVFTEFQKTISLGSLRPSNELDVVLWANSPNYPLVTWCQNRIYDETQITHPSQQ